MRRIIFIAILLAIVFIPIISCLAATYYMATTGVDGINISGDESHPWGTLQYSCSRMASGDTLIIKDGVYTGDKNQFNYNTRPPYGTPEAWTTIKAENDGGVVFDGENARIMFNFVPTNFSLQTCYYQFEGIIWCRSNSSTVGLYYASYVKFLRCGAYDTGPENTVNFSISRNCHYVLLEGCYAWGSGRYKFLVYGRVNNGNPAFTSSYVILRNCVGRADIINAPTEIGGIFSMYSDDDCLVQNCIAIDSDQEAHYFSNSFAGAFLNPATDQICNRITWRQCIALNVALGAASSAQQYGAWDIVWDNCVWWRCKTHLDAPGSLFSIRGPRNKFYNCTIGECSLNKSSWFMYGQGDNAIDTTLWNTTISDCTGGYHLLYQVEIQGYNNFYDNFSSLYVTGSNNTNLNPVYDAVSNPTGSIKYITRIETTSELLDSNLSDIGEWGGPKGANCRTLIGKSGTLWGEDGYNSDTGIPMWPFPNEDLIKEKMKAYNNEGVSGNRGFCVDGNGLYGGPITLTSYIWEYLGNPLPPEIYGNKELKNDLNSDGAVDVLDVQLCVNVILGIEKSTDIVNKLKVAAPLVDVCDVSDLQAVVNAVLGGEAG